MIIKHSLGISDDLDLCAHVYLAASAAIERPSHNCASWSRRPLTPVMHSPWRILDAAAAELALMVDATRRQLEFTAAEPVPVSYSGGVFEHVGATAAGSNSPRACMHTAPATRSCEPVLPPAIGAALYAAKRHGRPLSSAAIERLREESAARRGELES